MSLIDLMLEKCAILNKIRTSDGEGGFTTSWQEGAQIDCAIVLDSSISAKIAEADGFTNVYTITTKRNVQLEYHDVIKRLSDGKIFRITSDGSDKISPRASSLDMKQMSAERWNLT